MEDIKTALAEGFRVPSTPLAARSDPALEAFHRKMRWKGAIWNIQKTLNLVFYAFVFCVVGWFGAQYVDNRHPVDVQHELLTPAVKPNSEVKVRFSVDRHRACDLTLQWLIFDGANEVRRFEAGAPLLGVGDLGPMPPFVRGFFIPSYTHPGSARLRIMRSYKCHDNFLHTFDFAEPDIAFTILNKDGSIPKGLEHGRSIKSVDSTAAPPGAAIFFAPNFAI